MKKSYFLQCVLTSMLAFFVLYSDAFGQCAASIGGSTNVTCNGDCDGGAFATASGGTSPYTYSWNTNPVQTGFIVTGLCGGTGGICDSISFSCGDSVYTVTVTDAVGCVTTASVSISQGAPLIGGVKSIKDVSCNGLCDGIIEVWGCGGVCTGSSMFSLNGSPFVQGVSRFDSLCAGNYNIGITTNPIFAVCDTIYLNAIVVAEPLPITTTISSSSPCTTANDGSATVNPAGGTSPYSYEWRTPTGPLPNDTIATANGLSSGTYNVIVTDANGCTAMDTVVVLGKITASFFATQDARCTGSCDGSARAVASGGKSPYSYSWSPSPGGGTADSAFGLCANIAYTVTVTDDNGCTDDASFTPIALTTLTSNITPTDVTCGENNGTATADISGGASPYTYSWSPSGGTSEDATGLSRGTYTVTISDNNGCTVNDTVTINERCEIIPPNTFTPNGDGINDTWEIANLDKILFPNCEVKVYNRWGDIVFNQIGYDTESEWGEGSSTVSVNTLPSAVYYYVIDLKDGSDLLSGSITIIR